MLMDGTGSGNLVAVTSDNRMKVESFMSGTVTISGNIIIGSVSATVDSIYIQSGNNITGSFYQIPVTPTLNSANPVGSLIYAGAQLGSVVKILEGTTYVKVLSYSGTSLVGIGSWVNL